MDITFTRRLAHEDIVPGLFIAIAARIHELLPDIVDSYPGQRLEPVRVTCLKCADGDARRVLATCLPFVMAESADGSIETLDTRLCVLVQVDEMYALEQFTRPERDDCDE